MRPLPYLPNLLSSLRIALAPGMLGAAYSNSKTGFLILLGVALTTDMLDGFFARRWNAATEIGRRLDHWGDALTTILGALGIYFLWPSQMESEWQWALLALLAYLTLGIDRLIRRPDRESNPSWWEKALAMILPLSLVPLITGWSPWGFRIAAVLQALIALKAMLADNTRSAADKAAESVKPIGETNASPKKVPASTAPGAEPS
ncbi:MAG TPA: CDP-alcohol phosphatidyltransferase family protein [Opitutus sp.]|nr:CDP-alcohol phosphatidyltransferase family protein [Opitutus sp.]